MSVVLFGRGKGERREWREERKDRRTDWTHYTRNVACLFRHLTSVLPSPATRGVV